MWGASGESQGENARSIRAPRKTISSWGGETEKERGRERESGFFLTIAILGTGVCVRAHRKRGREALSLSLSLGREERVRSRKGALRETIALASPKRSYFFISFTVEGRNPRRALERDSLLRERTATARATLSSWERD